MGMTKKLVVACGLVAAAGVGVVMTSNSKSNDEGAAAGSGDGEHPIATHDDGRGPPAGDAAVTSEARSAARERAALRASNNPIAYEISRAGTRITINLAGGPSRLASFSSTDGDDVRIVDGDAEFLDRLRREYSPKNRPQRRAVHGKVVMPDGSAAGGAIVLAGRIRIDVGDHDEPHAAADDAVATDGEGRFTLDADVAGSVLIALTPQCMSDLTRSSPGAAATVTLACETELRGHIVRGDMAVPGDVALELADSRAFTLRLATDPQGHFALVPAPPGDFDLLASVSSAPDGIFGRASRSTVSIARDQITTIDIEVAGGTLVVLSAKLPPKIPDGFAAVSHILLRGAHDFRSLAEIDTLAASLGEDAVHAQSFAGPPSTAQLDRPSQFEGIQPGPHTACVALDEGPPVCRVVEIHDGQELVELELAL